MVEQVTHRICAAMRHQWVAFLFNCGSTSHALGAAFAGQYSEAAWCAVELEKASGTQADAEAAALLETASQRRAALTQVG